MACASMKVPIPAMISQHQRRVLEKWPIIMAVKPMQSIMAIWRKTARLRKSKRRKGELLMVPAAELMRLEMASKLRIKS